jgi:DNA-binding response OmpR family regulator
MSNILLLEDDDILQEIIEEYLIEHKFNVDSYSNGEEALDAIEKNSYDLLLLDINVPEINGFEILEYLREIKDRTPIIFITSLTSVSNLQKAFELGVNDYLKKPFDLDELLVRIKYHLKSKKMPYKIELDNITFYPNELKLIKNDIEYTLKTKEAQILKYFIEHKNQLISTEELINNIWQHQDIPTKATIRTYIKNLRKILGSESFENIKGVGYRFNIV